ncbi:MAG: ferrochelatase, partial [Dehalococcoidia bacterium]
GFGLIIFIILKFRGRHALIAVILSVIFFIAGYSLMTQVVLMRDDPRPIPELTRKVGDPGDGHTAVIYFTHGEPEHYDPIGWINQFNEFDEQGISFVPFVARPIFIYQLRNHYLQVGRSDHRSMHHRMLESLEQQFRLTGDNTTKFYISFLDDDPSPDAAIIQALNEGASRIIVSEVFLTISNHTAEGKELIEAVNPERFGVTLIFTGPLWDSTTLRSMFIQRANAHISDTDKSKVAVLLVGHGQPDEWNEEWPTETEQETFFRQEVLKLFEFDGYSKENLSLAWMEFKQPKPADKINEFINIDIEKILFFSAAISAESIHSQYDVPALVYEVDIPEDVQVINLSAWNDDPIVIEAIQKKIQASLVE